MNKYEKLIEYIINDDEARARALFHEIVVEKSREIYEDIMDEEVGIGQEIQDEEVGLEEADDELDDIDGMGGDPAEDMVSDMEDDMDDMGDDMDDMGDDMDDMGDDMGEEGLEDRVMDLESALDELKAEFDALMADEKDEPEHADMFGGEEAGEEDEEFKSEAVVREYVEKVSDGHGAEKKGAAEGHEAGKGGSVAVNKTSIVAGKNDMGGSTANIAKGGAENAPDGTSPKKAANYGTKGQGSLPHANSFENVPGAKAGDTFGRAQKAKTKEEGSVNKHSIESGK